MTKKIYTAGNQGKKVRSDCFVSLELTDAGGLQIDLQSKVEVMLAYLQTYDLVVSDASVIEENAVIYDSFYRMNNSKSGFVQNLIHNSYLGCCMAFNGEILEFALRIENIEG